MAKINTQDAVYLRMLLYGIAGSTKTRTSHSAALDPRSSPALVLNSGGNPVSTRDYAQRPTVIDLERIKDLNLPYDWFANEQPAGHPFAKEFGLKPGFKTLIVDGLTDVQRLSMSSVLGMDGKPAGPGDFIKKLEWDHWGKILGQMTNMAKMFYSLPVHVIMTALEKHREDRLTGRVVFSPLLSGQSDIEIPAHALAVGRLVHVSQLLGSEQKALKNDEDLLEESTPVALFSPTSRYVAKDQYGRLNQPITNPSVTIFLDRILEGQGTDTSN